jgi:hypothetical protein
MKDFFKFLGIIALVAVIGFGVAGCKGEEEEEEEEQKKTTPITSPTTPPPATGSALLPATFYPRDASQYASFEKTAIWGTDAWHCSLRVGYRTKGSSDHKITFIPMMPDVDLVQYTVSSVSGTTIKIKNAGGTEFTFCTNYEFSDNNTKLKFTGCGSEFSIFEGEILEDLGY